MAVVVTLRFEDVHDADYLIQGLALGYLDGRRLVALKDARAFSVVLEESVD